MKEGVKVFAGNQKGVTIMELLVVLAIIGIIVAIGVNMMGGVISKQRLRTAASEIQTRLRVAQMLSVVKNKPVTVVFEKTTGIDRGQEDSYYACLSDEDGNCSDFLNLDNGRTSSLEVATSTMHPLVEMYDFSFPRSGVATVNAVTFMPPSGLPVAIKNGVALINGAVCLMVEAGADDDDFGDRYIFRRITVDSLVGKATMWTNLKVVDGTAIEDNPDCVSQLPDTDAAVEWKKVF